MTHLEPKMPRNLHEIQTGSLVRSLFGLIVMLGLSTHLLDAASTATQARGLGMPYYAMMEYSDSGPKLPQRRISSSRLFGVLPEIPVPLDKAIQTDANQASRGFLGDQSVSKEALAKLASELERANGDKQKDRDVDSDDDDDGGQAGPGGQTKVAKGSPDEPRIFKGLGLGAGVFG